MLQTDAKGIDLSDFNDHLLEELKDPRLAVEYILDAFKYSNIIELVKALSQVAKAYERQEK